MTTTCMCPTSLTLQYVTPIAATHTLTIIKLPCIMLPSEGLIVAGTLLRSVVTTTRTCLHSIQGTASTQWCGNGCGLCTSYHTQLIEVHIAAVSKRVKHSALGFLRKLNPAVKRRLCWHTENMYINYTMIVCTYIHMHARLL